MEEGLPCWVELYRYREYAAAKKTKALKKGKNILENTIIEVIDKISPNKFNVGGAAILAEAKRNHQVVKVGANR